MIDLWIALGCVLIVLIVVLELCIGNSLSNFRPIKPNMFVGSDNNCIFVDVDETLVSWEQGPPGFKYFGWYLRPIEEHIIHIKSEFSKGEKFIVWSVGGANHAEMVVRYLGLENYVEACLSKPNYVIDDLAIDEFMHTRYYKGKWFDK